MENKIIKVARPFIGKEEVRAVEKVILSGNYISGNNVEIFEKKYAEYIGVKYAVAVNSGTAALHIALAVLGIGPGDEVIVPPLTFFSTISSVLHQNAIPIFADIDLENYCIDPKDIEKRITNRTKAVIPVHLYGDSAEMDEIKMVAKKYKIKIIEDACQAHGTEYKGKKVGSIGDIGCYSFFATKHITTGEGGMLVTNNRNYAELAKMIRNHGMSDRNTHKYLGYNYRMNEIAAALGIVQLKKIDKLNNKRIKNSLYLINKLNERKIKWLRTPRLKKYIKHTFFWCPILIDEEKLGMTIKDLRKCLLSKGIETRHRYWQPLYKQEVLIKKNVYSREFPFNSKHYKRKIDYSKIYLKNAETVAGKIIGLPNHPGLNRKDLDKIVQAIEEIKT
jgi:perosamine synthetase